MEFAILSHKTSLITEQKKHALGSYITFSIKLALHIKKMSLNIIQVSAKSANIVHVWDIGLTALPGIFFKLFFYFNFF